MWRLVLTLACVFFVGCSTQTTDLSTPIVPDTGAPSDTGDSVAIDDTAVPPDSIPTGVPPAGDAELTPVAINSGVVSLSADNTTIQFVGTHTGDDPNPRIGVFKNFAGTAAMDESGLKSVSVEIQTDSLETPILKLTNHLKSADFFDANVYPTAKFESTSITPIVGQSGLYSVRGNLTMLESTKEIGFLAMVTTNDTGLTLTGEVVIDRAAFGMDGMQERVNKEIELSFAIGRQTATPEGGQGFGGAGRGGGQRGGGGRGFDPAAIFQQRDTDGDGKLTGDEIADRMRDNLAEIDTDGDGAISLEELQERFRQFRGRGPGGGGRGPDGAGRPPRPE